jgi:hypothetical protein
MKDFMNNKSKSPYEPQSLPGMGYEPQGYEPRHIKSEDLKNELHLQIYKKQRQNDPNR